MQSPSDGLTAGQALALGVLQGPAELLPISSSAHTTAVAWLRGWDYSELDPALRKSFEVALHAGTFVAMVVVAARRRRDWVGLRLLALASAPPAIVGYAMRPEIERRLGTPRTIAIALLAGSAVMAIADRFPQARAFDDAGARDGAALGLAQACALIPGVSRAGATLAVARMLRFRAADAKLLSDEVALPVLAGAALLEVVTLRRLDRRMARAFAAGAGGAFSSALACAGVSRRHASSERLLPYAVYRTVLASWMLIRLRRGSKAPRR